MSETFFPLQLTKSLTRIFRCNDAYHKFYVYSFTNTISTSHNQHAGLKKDPKLICVDLLILLPTLTEPMKSAPALGSRFLFAGRLPLSSKSDASRSLRKRRQYLGGQTWLTSNCYSYTPIHCAKEDSFAEDGEIEKADHHEVEVIEKSRKKKTGTILQREKSRGLRKRMKELYQTDNSTTLSYGDQSCSSEVYANESTCESSTGSWNAEIFRYSLSDDVSEKNSEYHHSGTRITFSSDPPQIFTYDGPEPFECPSLYYTEKELENIVFEYDMEQFLGQYAQRDCETIDSKGQGFMDI